MRPQRGSCETSTIGAYVCLSPTAADSRAPNAASSRATCGSKLAPVPSGIGKTVRKPWIVSKANRSGMCSRDSVDGDALQLADARRVGDAEDRAEAVADVVLGDHEVGQQLDLLQLLLQGHLREQRVHPPLDAAVGRLARRLQHRLVARRLDLDDASCHGSTERHGCNCSHDDELRAPHDVPLRFARTLTDARARTLRADT